KNQIQRDITHQINLFESTLGVSLPNDLSIIVHPPGSNIDPFGIKNNQINFVPSPEFLQNTNKINPIFLELLQTVFPKYPHVSSQILGYYLMFKYFDINLIKLATETRYAFSEVPLSKNPDHSNRFKPLHISVSILASARISQIERDFGTKEVQKFIYSMKYGINNASERISNLDFKTFIRSLRLEEKIEERTVRFDPTGTMNELLTTIELNSERVWSNFPYFRNKIDYKIRLAPNSILNQSFIQMAQGKPESVVLETLNGVDDYFKQRKSNLNSWWIVALICSIILLILMAVSLLKGFKFTSQKNRKSR
ncbi:MAG: hypothetical protein KAH30_04835, partial [Caldisericia bacterium]|nr:hypothetical protein [Caldisericia bacterium]